MKVTIQIDDDSDPVVYDNLSRFALLAHNVAGEPVYHYQVPPRTPIEAIISDLMAALANQQARQTFLIVNEVLNQRAQAVHVQQHIKQNGGFKLHRP